MKPGSVVLTYHRVGPPDARFPSFPVSMFRTQMEWLARNCTPIHPNDLSASAASLGRLPVLVTFDDAYRDYYEYAYPILKTFGIPAVNFAPTDHVERGQPLWWDVVHAASHATRRSRVTFPWDPAKSFD